MSLKKKKNQRTLFFCLSRVFRVVATHCGFDLYSLDVTIKVCIGASVLQNVFRRRFRTANKRKRILFSSAYDYY